MQTTNIWRTRAPNVRRLCAFLISRRGLSQNAVAEIKRAEEVWQQRAQQVHRGERKSLFSILEERGFVKDLAGDRNALESLLTDKRIAAYSGIDPTAPSLHLGHLLPLMVLFWLYVHGHKAISLIGGATAKVGDPTGRLTSRPEVDTGTRLVTTNSLKDNVRSLWTHLETYADRHGYVRERSWRRTIDNNAVWLNKLSVIDFLSAAGTVNRIGAMLGRDTVKNKLSQGDGMSFAEFTYPLLQAYDWWHLYQSGCQLQIGGSDQYGNIVAGSDLIKHMLPRRSTPNDVKQLSGPFGLTVPLLTTAAGAKFGKSAGNAVWLNKNLTSPFELYGFLLRSADADVERYLKLFTFLPLDHISAVMAEHQADPGQRKAQHLLASEVVELVHGIEEAKKTKTEHTISRTPTLESLQAQTEGAEDNSNRIFLPRSLVFETLPAPILYRAGLATSVSHANRIIKAGGAYIARQSAEEGVTADGALVFRPMKEVTADTINDFIQTNGMLIIRIGKWNVKIVKIVTDEEYDRMGLDAPGWKEAKELKARSSST